MIIMFFFSFHFTVSMESATFFGFAIFFAVSMIVFLLYINRRRCFGIYTPSFLCWNDKALTTKLSQKNGEFNFQFKYRLCIMTV